MRPLPLVGLILVIAGAAALVLQLAGVFSDSAGLDLGPVEVEVSKERSLPWLPWTAGGAIVIGLALLASKRQ